MRSVWLTATLLLLLLALLRNTSRQNNVGNKAQRENLVRCEIVGVRSRRIAVETVSEVNRRKIDTLARHSTSDWHFCNAYNAPSIKNNN